MCEYINKTDVSIMDYGLMAVVDSPTHVLPVVCMCGTIKLGWAASDCIVFNDEEICIILLSFLFVCSHIIY